jgi:hypothetical protein
MTRPLRVSDAAESGPAPELTPRRLVPQAVCHRRRGCAARRARHSRPGGVLGDAGAVHAHRRGLPACLLDNRPPELRGDHDLPAANPESKGQGLLPHDCRRQQVRSRRREAGLNTRYVNVSSLTAAPVDANLIHRGPDAGQQLWLQIHRDVGKIAHQRRQRLLRHCTRDPQIQQGDVIIHGRPLRRPWLQRHPEDGHRGRFREEGLLWLRSNVRRRIIMLLLLLLLSRA